jgi:amidase
MVAGGGMCCVPVHNLDEIIKSQKFHPSLQSRLERAQQSTPQGPDSDACKAEMAYRKAFGAAVIKTMDQLKLDAFVYPTWSNPPRLIGDLNTPHGDNSQVFSPTTGFPAIQVPMGYTRNGVLPGGVTFFGRAWDESTLIKLAYGYEQLTHHRHPPSTTPKLGRRN